MWWTLVYIVDTGFHIFWAYLRVGLLGYRVLLCLTLQRTGIHSILCLYYKTHYEEIYSQLSLGLSLAQGLKFLERGGLSLSVFEPLPLSSPALTTACSKFPESCWEWSWPKQCPDVREIPNTPETLSHSVSLVPVKSDSLSGIEAAPYCPLSSPAGCWPPLSAAGPLPRSWDFSRLPHPHSSS